MAFLTAQPIVPVAIGSIKILLYTNPIDSIQKAIYDVEILDALGGRIRVPGDVGDLTPHLTELQISGLLQFMSDMRIKAESEFLP